jgi:hypothetical protein
LGKQEANSKQPAIETGIQFIRGPRRNPGAGEIGPAPREMTAVLTQISEAAPALT